MLETLQKYLREKNISVSKILMTNRDLRLINVSHSIFSVVRHFLCIWHVNKNVLTHCKFDFDIKEELKKFYSEWQAMMYAHITEINQEKWNKLQNDHYARHFEIINYLKNIWIRSFDRKIIKYYINKIRHFFFTTTSRSKSAHRVVKHNLRFPTDDSKIMMNNIEILLMNQRKKYAKKLDDAKMRVFFDLKISSFRDLVSQVTFHALRIIFNQYCWIEKSDHSSVYTHSWIIISNLSCSHLIKNWMTTSTRVLLLEDVHLHWHFVRSTSMFDSLLLIQESVVVRDRERSVRSTIESFSQVDLLKNMSMKKVSTQRNSSQFEIIENIVSSKKQVSIQDRVVTRARERKTRYESRTRSRTRTKNEIRVENEVENEIVIRNEIVKIRMIQMLQLKQLMKFVAVEDVKIEVINEVIQ